MSHSRSARKTDEAFAEAAAEEKARRDEKMERAQLYAQRVIRTFNACAHRGRVPAFFPTIRCCVVSKHTRLETVCPGCGMITHSHIDKMGENLHPLATVTMLLFKIGCSRCGERAPLPRIRAITSW